MSTRCNICGEERPRTKMILRRLNGEEHYCCGISCEVSWEKRNLVGVSG